MMKRNLIVIGMLALLAVFLLSACGPGKVEKSVEMNEFKFTPDTLEVPAGAEVTLDLSNTGALEHNYIIMVRGKDATVPFDTDDENNVFWKTELDRGQSATVTFTAPEEPGEYEVVCSTPGHLEQGMKASLIVTEP
jgi:plastocyanin